MRAIRPGYRNPELDCNIETIKYIVQMSEVRLVTPEIRLRDIFSARAPNIQARTPACKIEPAPGPGRAPWAKTRIIS
jgi:hypothetical protein